jgi:hypothetical protein
MAVSQFSTSSRQPVLVPAITVAVLTPHISTLPGIHVPARGRVFGSQLAGGMMRFIIASRREQSHARRRE